MTEPDRPLAKADPWPVFVRTVERCRTCGLAVAAGMPFVIYGQPTQCHYCGSIDAMPEGPAFVAPVDPNQWAVVYGALIEDILAAYPMKES